MVGELVGLAIPYKNFKEKIRITNKYMMKPEKYDIKVYKNFIVVTLKERGKE